MPFLPVSSENIEVVEEMPFEDVFEGPVVVYEEKPSLDTVIEMHEPDSYEDQDGEEVVFHNHEIAVEPQLEISELPGVDELDPDLEAKLEVDENDLKESDKKEETKNVKKVKWNWESRGADGFVSWIKERLNDVPKHSGYDSAGIERAISYMQKLDSEISKAMRNDLDGDLDSNQIEEIRAKIDEGIERLHERLKKITKLKKKADHDLIVKEAQKAVNIAGIVITVPLLISRIARVCINGTVSAGHDIQDLFKRQVKAYKLSDREQAECMQLLADMGYPIKQDRGIMLGDDVDPTSSDNFDWAANYRA